MPPATNWPIFAFLAVLLIAGPGLMIHALRIGPDERAAHADAEPRED